MKNFIDKFNFIYVFNTITALAVVFSVILMFAVQFKVESLQNSISKTKKEIASYEDKIQMLDIEWSFLTRPERLRKLSAQFLQNNDYIVASQIKNKVELKEVYFANYQSKYSSEMAMR